MQNVSGMYFSQALEHRELATLYSKRWTVVKTRIVHLHAVYGVNKGFSNSK